MLGGSESQRAAVYRNLAAMEGSGIPLRTALDRVRDPALVPVQRALEDGRPAEEAFAASPALSPLEVALVRAGAKSGQLVEAYRSLELLFEERARARRDLVLGLAYPVVLLHLAVMLPNLKTLIFDGVWPYAKVALVPVVGLWAALVVLAVVFRGARRAAPGAVDGFVGALPVVGGIAHKRAVVHGLQAFLALYRAGVPVRDALEGARDAAPHFPVKKAFERIVRRVDEGATLGDAWRDETGLPRVVCDAASTGAATGKLEDTLGGARRSVEEAAQTQRRMLLGALPVVAYLMAAAFIGWTVISFYTSQFQAAFDQIK